MKGNRLIVAELFVGLLIMLAAAAPALAAQPSLPHAFYGNVAINGSPAPAGTQVEARGQGVINGVQGNPIITTQSGKWGSADPFGVKLLVQGTVTEGTGLTFYVNGTSTGQTTPWHAGDLTSLDLTLTTSQSGGGTGIIGGGASGEGTLAVNLVGNQYTFPIGSNGRIDQAISRNSGDGRLTLNIRAGTIALDRDSKYLSTITAIAQTNVPAIPGNSRMLGLAYDFTPAGARFNPPISLVFAYSDADLAPGMSEADLAIGYFDTAQNKWVMRPSIVDSANNSVTADVDHFTPFAIIGTIKITSTPSPPNVPAGSQPTPTPVPSPKPGTSTPTPVAPAIPPSTQPGGASFSNSSLAVTPLETGVGEKATVSLMVGNTGMQAGTHKVSLKIDGQVVETRDIALNAGETRTISFTISRDKPGTYSLDCNGLTCQWKVVEKAGPPAAAPLDVSGSPKTSGMNWMMLGGVAAGVLLVGAIILIIVRRQID